MEILLQLFISFATVGLFCVGGGYASMPLIEAEVIEKHGWLTLNEFVDIFTISQMTPGPIGINAATFVGSKVGGIPGSVAATAGFVFPSVLIVLLLGYLYYKYGNIGPIRGILNGLRPAVVALIASAGLSILFLGIFGDAPASFGNLRIVECLLFLSALFLLRKYHLNAILIIFGTGVVGTLIYSVL